MMATPPQLISLAEYIAVCFLLGIFILVASATYNLVFHPLAHVPGPLLARASGIPSWYHAYRGDRHVWLWQQFQVYGSKIRPEPNTVLFCDPEAYADIYSIKSNVRRGKFYTAWQRNDGDKTTLNTVDVAEHAQKRRLLNLCFTDKSVRAASSFVTKHVDRWNHLLVQKCDGLDWSETVDFSAKVDNLVFDIMGDLCFGKSFDVKEPGANILKSVPQNIMKYMQFYCPICRSPFLNFIVWLKPRGLNKLFNSLTPSPVQQYYQFVHESVSKRLALQKEQAEKPESERRQDIIYFLCEAQDPDTGHPAYDESTLRAEANLLIIAGSDTTAISLSGIFFYLTNHPYQYQKLVKEIRTTFDSAENIVYGPKLSSCAYLKAFVDEAMRLTPTGPSELPREVLAGGIIIIKGEYFPEGTLVGTSPWADSRNEEIYGDANIFRPERWIADETETGVVTQEEMARMRSNFHPFAAGPGNCVGKNLAITEMMITVARTLHRLDVRRAPGSTVGGGAYELGWGARDPKQFQLIDAYISLRHGPEVQFRKRTD
ncbi:cytochrome P450 monooxygenase-like protein [Hypoxylon sp. FL1284]|nr:cytochrome P450 monooxygenase-like protein [Hypoxylon sp. FL1284]